MKKSRSSKVTPKVVKKTVRRRRDDSDDEADAEYLPDEAAISEDELEDNESANDQKVVERNKQKKEKKLASIENLLSHEPFRERHIKELKTYLQDHPDAIFAMACNGHGQFQQVIIFDVSNNNKVTVFYNELTKHIRTQERDENMKLGSYKRKAVEDAIACNKLAGCPEPVLILMDGADLYNDRIRPTSLPAQHFMNYCVTAILGTCFYEASDVNSDKPQMILKSIDELLHDSFDSGSGLLCLHQNLGISEPSKRPTGRYNWDAFSDSIETLLLTEVRKNLKPKQRKFFRSVKAIVQTVFALGRLFGMRKDFSAPNSQFDESFMSENATKIIEKLKQLRDFVTWPSLERSVACQLEPPEVSAKMTARRASAVITWGLLSASWNSYIKVLQKYPTLSFNAFVLGFEYQLALLGVYDYGRRLVSRMVAGATLENGFSVWCADVKCTVEYVATMKDVDEAELSDLMSLKPFECPATRSPAYERVRKTAVARINDRLRAANRYGGPIDELLYLP